MTTEQQFSEEYIDYMQSDEAKALRALWVPAVGDWVADKWPHKTYVELIGESPCDFTVGDISEPPHNVESFWLPTLFQLIRVIEGAGWEWRRSGENLLGWPRKRPSKLAVFDHKDLLLAAAQLAVRVVADV